MRHAKAEQAGPTDFQRELAARGMSDAAAAGAWLAGQGLVPDHVLVSAATRTRQTWSQVAGAAGWETEAVFDTGLYGAGPETVLDLVRETPPQSTAVVVIGHNPTVAYLAQLLDDGEGSDDAGREMALGYPTSAAAVFEVDVDWSDLAPGTARLVAFGAARG